MCLGVTSEHCESSTLRIGQITLAAQSTSCAIRPVDLDHADSSIREDARECLACRRNQSRLWRFLFTDLRLKSFEIHEIANSSRFRGFAIGSYAPRTAC